MAARDEFGAPDPVDIHVGSRLRIRRKILGMSQEVLAQKLGVTFQQVQKYERGSNRVSSSKLYLAAQALEAPIAYFFDGLPDPSSGVETAGADIQQAVSAFLMTPEGLELARLLPQLEGPMRARLLDLVRVMARPADEAASKAA